MRIARLKPADTSANGPAGTYYHLINRIAGQPGDLPFGDQEKEKLLRMIHDLCQLYAIQPLSCVIMGNHYHLIVHAPLQPPTQEEAIRRFKAYYGDKRVLTEKQLRDLPEKLRDISQFIKAIQHPFTCWFNRTRLDQHRRGALWQGRFKSVILESQAVIHCIVYVELNPVRARIIGNPADYRFGSWCTWETTGKHPFGKAALEHLRACLGPEFKSANSADLRRHLRGEMSKIIACEAGASTAEAVEAKEAAKIDPSLAEQLTRRIRHWSDGLIIGSRIFVMELAAASRDRLAPEHPERIEKHRLGQLLSASDTAFFSWRNLQKNQT
jgi:REP element-mobilizing transposase RayT